jgi:hypothetical protein
MIQSPGPHFCKYDFQQRKIEFALIRRGRKGYSTIYTPYSRRRVTVM